MDLNGVCMEEISDVCTTKERTYMYLCINIRIYKFKFKHKHIHDIWITQLNFLCVY